MIGVFPAVAKQMFLYETIKPMKVIAKHLLELYFSFLCVEKNREIIIIPIQARIVSCD